MWTPFVLTLLSMPLMDSFVNMPVQRNMMNLRMSNDYLQHLDNMSKQNMQVFEDKFKDKFKDANYTDVEQIQVDCIFLNIYKLDNIFFNRNSKNVMFQLRHNMENLYYVNNDQVQKIANTTKLSSKGLKKFVVAEMNPDIDVIAYNNTA
jgi:hypothetical protein